MIKIDYQIVEEGVSRKDIPRHHIEFETDADYYKWLRSQTGHPWLSIHIMQDGDNNVLPDFNDNCD